MGSVSPDALKGLEKKQDTASSAPGNIIKLISTHLPGELVVKYAERDQLVEKLRAVNAEIAHIETHVQIAAAMKDNTPTSVGADAGADGLANGTARPITG